MGWFKHQKQWLQLTNILKALCSRQYLKNEKEEKKESLDTNVDNWAQITSLKIDKKKNQAILLPSQYELYYVKVAKQS